MTRAVTYLCLLFLFVLPLQAQDLAPGSTSASDTAVGRRFDASANTLPVSDKWWWSDEWYDSGQRPVPANHRVVESALSYINPEDDTEVPAVLFVRPDQKSFQPSCFSTGAAGLMISSSAWPGAWVARGFVVLSPDVYSARFIEQRPIEHLPETESDVNAGLDFLLKRTDISTSRACVYSHTRGGYCTLKVAVKFARQNSAIACYVSFYPHWQDPAAPELMQVYRYAAEIDKLELPALVFIGEYEQYQRHRSIETAVQFMKQAGKDVKLIIYPWIRRDFDFWPPNVRTFADDLATKDSNQRAAAFIRKHLEKWKKE